MNKSIERPENISRFKFMTLKVQWGKYIFKRKV
jgi:hypothetical protein